MRILVWGINYAPEVTGIGPHNAALCEFLKQAGHDVRMVTTFPYYPSWTRQPGDHQLFRRDFCGPIEVYRCWHYIPRRVTTWRRLWHELSFVLTSFYRVLTLPRADLVIVVSPPLLLGFAAWVVQILKGSPFLFHVQDLQPDAAAGLGLIRNSAFLKLLFALERFAYAKAIRVSGISAGMLKIFREKGLPAGKLIYFPNAIALGDLPGAGNFREKHGYAPDDFLAVYSGNLGVKQGLEILIDAAADLRNPKIRLIICGEGAQRQQLEEMSAARRLNNLRFLPLQPTAEFHHMLGAADLCLITQRKGTGDYFFPSKLLAALGAGRPVLSVADSGSELAGLVAEGNFGLNVEPERPVELTRTLEALAKDPARLVTWGQAARAFASRFEVNAVLSRFAADLQAALPDC